MIARVLGHGWSLLEDLEAYGGPHDVTVAVNRAAISYTGHVDHWVTLHPEKLRHWKMMRAAAGGSDGYVTWSRREPRLVHRIAPHVWGGGSGLLAVRVALEEIGADRVVLCGMPMDNGPHCGESDDWGQADRFRPDWEGRAPNLRGRVVSMSGWTRELLGGPEVWDGD